MSKEVFLRLKGFGVYRRGDVREVISSRGAPFVLMIGFLRSACGIGSAMVVEAETVEGAGPEGARPGGAGCGAAGPGPDPAPDAV